jgi:hypothetical protein
MREKEDEILRKFLIESACSTDVLDENLNNKKGKMEILPKSKIIAKILWALDHKENIDEQYIQKNTGNVVHITITLSDRQTFIDENGVKWVRE